MPPPIPSDQALFRELVARRDVLNELIDAARGQLQLIEAEDFDALWTAQRRKERLVARLGAGGPAEASLRTAWDARRDAMPADLRRRCERLIDESAALLETLMEEERISRTALEQRMTATRQDLAAAAHSVRSRQPHRQSERGGVKRALDVET